MILLWWCQWCTCYSEKSLLYSPFWFYQWVNASRQARHILEGQNVLMNINHPKRNISVKMTHTRRVSLWYAFCTPLQTSLLDIRKISLHKNIYLRKEWSLTLLVAGKDDFWSINHVCIVFSTPSLSVSLRDVMQKLL